VSCFELNVAAAEVSGSLVLFSGEGVYWLAEFASGGEAWRTWPHYWKTK